MTIQEAIKSGKRIRRKNDVICYEWFNPTREVKFHGANQHLVFTIEDVLSEDWEVEEEMQRLSIDQVSNALKIYGEYIKLDKPFDGHVKALEMLGFKL